ncbi:MAG TPA: pilus assembly protein TadG-related protein [Candidatus Angelobacter sp.]|nr:pilus assembly protein TadG-related protein [Candidatus Angelobacter sp.]
MRNSRRSQRGQMLPLASLMAVLILGAGALAVDLTLQTHDRRSLQNVSDAAALAAAQDLADPSAATAQASRILAVTDAIKVLHTELGFPIPNANYAAQWAQGGACNNGATVCYADNITAGEYTFSIDSPPRTADAYGQASYNADQHYVEITLRRTTGNPGFAGVIGVPTGTTGAHSIAYHLVPGTAFGFALWANTVVSTGNEIENVIGDAYAYRDINPQANGHAGFCVSKNADGSGGHLVLGAPQFPNALPSPDPASGQAQQYLLSPNGHDPDVVQFLTSCATAGAGQIAQEAAMGCPASVQGLALGSSTYTDTTYTKACVSDPAVAAPTLKGPTDNTSTSSPLCAPNIAAGGSFSPGYYACTGNGQAAITVHHTLAQGIYHVHHNPNAGTDVVIDGTAVAADPAASNCPTTGYQTYLCGVTFVLDAGAVISLSGNSSTAIITPYNPPNGSLNDGKYPIYSPAGASGATVNVSNNGATLAMAGTVYMPGGSVNIGQNAFVFIQGQAIVNVWNVQSGNHTNPDVYWDGSRVASENEVIRLVE